MVRFFIDRPVFSIVISLVITITGLLAMLVLPIAQYPRITLPTINISTAYPGANAEVVEQSIGQLIEQQVNGAEGMLYMDSLSSSDGYYSLNVTFALERDADMAAVIVQNRAAVANASLPADVMAMGVTTRKKTPDVLMYFGLRSPDGTYDEAFLKNYGSIYMVDGLKRVKGVGDVAEYGSDFGMRIWLDPEKLLRYGLTTADVMQAVREQNLQAPAGKVGAHPAPAGQAFQYSAEVRGRLVEPDEFAEIILRSDGKGGYVRLMDVARVEMAQKEYRFIASINGGPAAAWAINLTPEASALETAELIRTELARMSAQFPEDMELVIVIDNTVFVSESLKEVVHTFFEALLLVLIVVTLFLQSWRATLIPMLAVPVSLIGTFAAFALLGFTINTLTLFALILAIGIVVDDAIVVVEAVEHHMRKNGLSARDATYKAMQEVAGPVVAIALVLCAVFVPVAFLGGISGVMYQQFGVTVAVSVILSALVALTLTPALCALLLKPHDANASHTGIGRFFGAFNRHFDRLTERYGRGVALTIQRSAITLTTLVALSLAALHLMSAVPGAFVPEEDQGYFIASVQLPPAASLERTREAAAAIEAIALDIPGVETSLSISGINILTGASQSDSALLVVKLLPWDERTSADLSLRNIMREFVAATRPIADALVIPFNPPPIPGLSATGGFSFMLQDQSGNSAQELQAVANDFMQAARARPEIGQIYSTFNANTPSLRFEVDREKTKKLGVPLNDVFATLQTFLGGAQINDFSRFGRTYKVTMQAEAAFRGDVEALSSYHVRSAQGEMVPLTTLVDVVASSAPTSIKRYNLYRAAEIGGSPAAGYSSGQAMQALEAVAAATLPAGYSYEWSGLSRQEKESAGKAPIVLALALLFVFLFLAAQYESWSIPFAVLFAIPLGIFGAFVGIWSTGLTNNVYTQIGLILLVGLAAKNAILIVEFAKMRREEGMSLSASAIEAAKLRLRPILMTSFAFILGVVPLVLASGAGAASRVSLGISVFSGMLAATLLAIFIVPTLFSSIQGLAEKMRHRSS